MHLISLEDTDNSQHIRRMLEDGLVADIFASILKRLVVMPGDRLKTKQAREVHGGYPVNDDPGTENKMVSLIIQQNGRKI